MNGTTRIFQEYLKANRLKLTSQRKLILDIFVSMSQLLTAEELFREVSEIDPGISLSTVYRTFKHLQQAGLARCVHYGDGTTRYEPSDGQSSYLFCEGCGKKVPVLNPYLECLQQESARQEGFRMFRSQMVIYGLCHDCNKEKELCAQKSSVQHQPIRRKQ